jgi:hypothetical protein
MVATHEVTRCSRCILPDSLPSVKLDEGGVCSHCRTFSKVTDDWERNKSRREPELERLFDRVKKLRRPYDCLVTLSGGKDSTYTLYHVSKVYGLKCLCFTFDNGFLSEYAKRNIENAVTATGADHVFYRIDRGLLLRLYRLFLSKCGNFCPACHRYGETSFDLVARAFRIPLVIGGSGSRISYLSTVRELHEGGDVAFFRNVVRGEPLEKEVGPLWHVWRARREEIVKDLYRFRVVRVGLRRLFGMSWDLVPLAVPSIGLFDFVQVPYSRVLSTIQDEMGWTKPPDQFEHMDCLLHEIPFYIHTLKFPELTTGTLYRSGLVRLGEMTRSEAMEAECNELRNPLPEPPILARFLQEIEMSHDEFLSSVGDWKTLGSFRRKG